MDKKTKITKTERLQLIGLLTLAHQAYKRQKECSVAMVEIVGNHSGFDTADPGLLDEIYFDDNWDIDVTLKHMGITVE